MDHINSAELLLFTRNTTRLIKKIMEIYHRGKLSDTNFIQKMKMLKENLGQKFTKLELGNPLVDIKDLDCAIEEYFEQNSIFEPRNTFFLEISEKIQRIRENNLDEVEKFCDSNRTLLKDLKSTLRQMLETQTFIHFIIDDKRNEAIEYVRKNEINKNYIKKWLFLLIKSPEKHKQQIKDHLNLFCKEYRTVLCYIKGIPPQTRLTNRALAGIMAFNSPDCLNKKKESQCPTCLPWIQKLAIKLPHSKRNNTFIRCKGSNQEINESNRPLIYESKWIYSEEYLRSCGYVVYCKKTERYYQKAPKICYFL